MSKEYNGLFTTEELSTHKDFHRIEKECVQLIEANKFLDAMIHARKQFPCGLFVAKAFIDSLTESIIR